MSNPTKQQEVANCDDWTKIALHCKECGVQFFRKVKGQRYCDDHRHLAGAEIRPQEAELSRKEILAECIRLRKHRTFARDAEHCDYPDCEQHNALVVARLREAIVKAIQIIQTWHNMGMTGRVASNAWDLYWRNAPEMKLIREALIDNRESES